ncbi:MAG: PfkB family carbohydrate kinase [Acidimicrobiales bacterium]
MSPQFKAPGRHFRHSQVRDTTGAGNAFNAGLVAALARGSSMGEA